MRIFIVLVFCFNVLGAQNLPDTITKKEKKLIKKNLFVQNNDAFKTAGIIVSQNQFQDTRMSPLIFSGIGVGVNFNYTRFGHKYMKIRQLRLQYNALNNNELPDEFMHLAKLEYSYGLHKKFKFPIGKLYLGGSINNLLNTRLYFPLGNNALAADNSLSLSPTFFWIHEKPFFKRSTYFAIQGGFNLLNFCMRYPQFIYTGLEAQLLSMNNYNKFFIELQFLPRLKYSKENHFNLSYIFEAYTFSSQNDQKRIANYFNGIKIGYWLKTK